MMTGARTKSSGSAMSSYAYRARLFKLRGLLFSLPLLIGIGYYRWIAPYFGPAHIQRVRVGVPRALSRAFLRLNGIRTQLFGAEHLTSASGRPRLLMVNHNSRFDGYILLAVMDTPFKSFWSNTAHITTERFSLVEAFGRAYDLFFVHDKSDKRRTLKEFRRAEDYLNIGATLSVFPEGTFSDDGEIRGFGSSCVGLAIRTGADIVPIVMADTETTFEKPHLKQGAKDVRIRIMPPVSTIGCSRQDIARLTSELEASMNEELRRMRTGESE